MEDGRGSSGIGSDKSIGLAEGILLPAEAVESNRSRPKSIAYYHIAELSAYASLINTYVGFERCVNCFIENAKITVMWLTA